MLSPEKIKTHLIIHLFIYILQNSKDMNKHEPERAEDVKTNDEEDKAYDREDEVSVGHHHGDEAPVPVVGDVHQALGVVGGRVPEAGGAAVQAGESCERRMRQDINITD